MNPYWESENGKIYHGDCLDVLSVLYTLNQPSKLVNMCVTSPPYYGLRDYQVDGQIGLEETPEAYIQRLVEVFREVRRVLRDDGTLWVNIGDSYAGGGPHHGDKNLGKSGTNKGCAGSVDRVNLIGYKPKDLIGIPWMLAFALRADGWWLRSDIIWNKPSCMPESVQDRPTRSHEYVFLLSKNQKYFYDADAIKDPIAKSTKNDSRLNKNDYQVGRPERGYVGSPSKGSGLIIPIGDKEHRNKRTVWTVTTKPYKEAHFATFPEKLIEPCVFAGCPKGGVVLDPFFGAGTTGMVAYNHGRQFIGIELNEKYIQISIKRIENETKQLRLFK